MSRRTDIWCDFATEDAATIEHWHVGTEFIFISSGNLVFNAGGEKVDVPSGNIIMTRRFARHNSISFDADYSRYCMIVQANDIQHSTSNENLLESIYAELKGRALIVDMTEVFDETKAIFEKIRAEYINPGEYNEEYVHGLLAVLFVLILRSLKVIQGNKKITRVDEIKAYIDEHYAEPSLSVTELARIHYVSKDYMTRAFKASTGSTPKEYIIGLRLNAAYKLLQSSEEAVGVIAEKSGFNDVSHFIRSFRNHYKTTPNAYRRSLPKSSK